MQVSTFGILGAGTLGWRIGLQAAISGYDVLMVDLRPEVLAKAQHFQAELLGKLVKHGRVPVEELSTVLARIRGTTDGEAFAKTVDFVSESVTEDIGAAVLALVSSAGAYMSGHILVADGGYTV